MSLIDDYLNQVTEPNKSELQRVRVFVSNLVPDAEEVITYGMPGFKYKKKYLIAYAPFKDHLSIFPGSEAVTTFSTDLAEFKTSKGTIQFTIDKPLPDNLLQKIVLQRKKSIDNA
jgi:uncharacterized protein YdhG (YjbR/CyaY superfamily)